MYLKPTEAAVESIVNPGLQVANTRQLLREVVKSANEEINLVTNRKARTLLETTIALVQGLLKAYDHCEQIWGNKNKKIFGKREN